jgi:hypothetical protein
MLRLDYVEKIHRRLLTRYGARWVSLWSGIEQRDIQADWAQQLDGMSPASIKKALASLPADFPPTCTAFRLLGVIREESASPPALQAPENFNSPAALEARARLAKMLAGWKGASA